MTFGRPIFGCFFVAELDRVRAKHGGLEKAMVNGSWPEAKLFANKITERVLLGDVFHAKNDAKTLCFTVISGKNLSRLRF